jgi:predicted P-loop ATPase
MNEHATSTVPEAGSAWMDELLRSEHGEIKHTIKNLRLIFTHDSHLQQIKFDAFCQDDISLSPLFRNVNGCKVDEESVGKIQDYLEQTYFIRLSQNKVFEILKTTALERSFNPVCDFITREKWDWKPRISTVLIRYLGAEDTPLVREQTKLWFVAAVARVFQPGCKFDNVLTLPGPQGIGKSTFFKTIAGEWFSDSFSFASGDKEKVETIMSAWIIEISELNGMKRANDSEAAKAILSRTSDFMRPAYGHKVTEYKRHNVFAATTNETNFLQGDNGNRRWWVITVNGTAPVSKWMKELVKEVPQLWAEAYTYYTQGISLFLSPEFEEEANKVQILHSSILCDPVLDDIKLYLDRQVPVSYREWSIPNRLNYQKGITIPLDEPMTSIDIVTARQLIEEVPNDLIRRCFNKYTPQYVNRLMEQVHGWRRSDQEKVKGLHPVYCDKTGRAKRPWIREPENM